MGQFPLTFQSGSVNSRFKLWPRPSHKNKKVNLIVERDLLSQLKMNFTCSFLNFLFGCSQNSSNSRRWLKLGVNEITWNNDCSGPSCRLFSWASLPRIKWRILINGTTFWRRNSALALFLRVFSQLSNPVQNGLLHLLKSLLSTVPSMALYSHLCCVWALSLSSQPTSSLHWL